MSKLIFYKNITVQFELLNILTHLYLWKSMIMHTMYINLQLRDKILPAIAWKILQYHITNLHKFVKMKNGEK